MTLRAVVVDDEPLLAQGLSRALTRRGVEVLETCLDGPSAVDAIRRWRPDVVFLDIQMPGLDGFQVLEELAGELPLVVFVTAYDQYALQAFAVHAVDYLLKPVGDEALDVALGRVQALVQGCRSQEAAARVMALLEGVEGRRPGRFVAKDGDRVRFIKEAEVEAIEATGKYMHLHLRGGSHMIRETLAALEERLDPARFLRVHRSWMVAIDQVAELRTLRDGSQELHLHSGRRVPVSRPEAVQRLIGQA